MIKCFNCPNLFKEDGKLKWCKKCCIGECLNNSGPCDDFYSRYEAPDEYNEDCTRCRCQENPCICDCECSNCKLWLSLYQKPLEIHLKNCTKCISWKEVVYNNIRCPNEIKCTLTKCPNFEICSNKEPLFLLCCWGDRCHKCDMVYFENSTIEEKNEFCPILPIPQNL